MQSANVDAKFVYNENGLRVQKIVNGVVTDYVLHGKNVVHMTSGTDELHFFYDAQNRPAVVVYNGTAYAYVKNLQGDVIAILDGAGNVVVSYAYDAWGQPIGKNGSMASTLGTLNPFRYRGYVFDEETGLYYLRSRYYNPQWGRFVNADILICNNIYRYSHNSPINRTDDAGTWDHFELQGKVVDNLADYLEAVVEYSIANQDNPDVYTVSYFLENCENCANKGDLQYTQKQCAAAIAHQLKHGMSKTGMTSMMRNDIIVAMEIENPRKGYKGLSQEFLPAGSILMVIDWNCELPAKHGGVVANDLNAYQSSKSSKVFVHQDLYIEPWTHIGWHKGVRLDDELIPFVLEYIEELRYENERVEVE